MALLYAGSIVCWAATARYFGAFVAIAVSAALLAYQGYALMFHELSSEPVFAAAFALLGACSSRGLRSQPSAGRFAARRRRHRPARAGAARETPCCSRSRRSRSSSPGTWRDRVRWAAAVRPRCGVFRSPPGRCTTACASTRGRSPAAATRSSPSTARSSPTTSSRPRTARPRAGSQRRCSSDLLTREPYRSYGVTLDELFAKGASACTRTCTSSPTRSSAGTTTTRCFVGQGSRACALIPARTPRGVARDGLGSSSSKALLPRRPQRRRRDRRADPTPADASSFAGRRLPAPTEGEPIPAGRSSGSRAPISASARSGRRRPSGTSSSTDASDRPRFERIQRETQELFDALAATARGTPRSRCASTSSRAGSRGPWMWILLGLVATRRAATSGSATLVALALAALSRRAPERARPLRRPPLRPSRRAGVRALRARRTPRRRRHADPRL